MYEGILENRRVVFVFPSLQLGGAERQGLAFARYLKQHARAHVEVWSLGGGERVAELCLAENIPVRVVPFRLWTTRIDLLSQLLRFAMELRRAKVDVLLPYVMQPNLVCGATWRLGGVRTCIWQQRDVGKDRGPRFLERLATRQTPFFVSNSTAGMQFLEESLGVPGSRVYYVRNGVQIAAAVDGTEAWRARLGVDSAAFLACMVANITTAKDHGTLLRAWRMVLDQVEAAALPQPVLLLAGRFGDAEHLAKALAFDLELGRSVRFLGAVDDVTGLLRASNLCVFNSRMEGCPNGVLEAMACGLPVVGTDIPGIRDALGDVGGNFLSVPGDAPAMARIILDQMELSKEVRSGLGDVNFDRIRGIFSCEKMVESTLELILRGMKL
jgi:glycosyltransferase involved in cell wall biosynthesis